MGEQFGHYRLDERFASTTDLAIAAQQSLGDAVPGGWPGSTATQAPSATRPVTTMPGFDGRGRQSGAGVRPPTTSAFPGTAAPGRWPPAGAASKPEPRPGRRRRLLLLVALIVAVLVVAAVFFINSPAGQLSPSGTAAPPSTAAAGGASTATRLDISGYATGTLTSASVICQKLGGSSWSWTVQGAIGDAPVEIGFTTNNWRGGAVYNTTSITDDQGGMLSAKAGTVSFLSNGNDTGKLTVAADERSGTIEVAVDAVDGDQQLRISGSWRCA